MIRIEASTQIDQPRDRVFEFLSDVDRLREWQTGVIESRRLSDGAVRVGFQFEETAKVGPWKLQTICTVTEMKPSQRFAFEAKSTGPLDYDGAFDLQPVAGGTRLTLTGNAQLKGAWRLIQPLFAADLRKESRTELAAMKRVLEAESVPKQQAVTSI